MSVKNLLTRLSAISLLAAMAFSAGCESSGSGTHDGDSGKAVSLRSSPIRCVYFSHDKLTPGDSFTVTFELVNPASVNESYSLVFATSTGKPWSDIFTCANPFDFKATGGETKFTLSGCKVKAATWTVNVDLSVAAVDANGDGAAGSVIVTP